MITPNRGARTQGDDSLPLPERRSHAVPEYLGVLAVFSLLVLIALVFKQLDMLTSAFRRVFYLATIGFVLHHFLPMRQRLPFFVLLCLGALLLVMGGSPDQLWDGALALQRALPIAAIGSALISICVLSIGFWKRAALLGAAGGAMALFRAGILGDESLAIIWPVLASMFMFRLLIYLYDVATAGQRPRLFESLAYFFLLPNSCVTLFPLIDFRRFCRSHYDTEALAIYQRGLQWIVRGVLQLVVYRLIQQLLALKAEDITNGTELIQFILANAFLYIKVSGQFHLIVGLLLLFGFNLPETNRRYFLASSFTEYWRRVNIYWKDFIIKVFYYPAFFRLKTRGTTLALVIATLWSFFVTWVLHLYQTWWLKGSVTFSWPDVLFWFILAILVLVNSLWEMKRGRQRKLASGTYSVRSAFGLTLRTAGTFACISLLWSLWSSASVSEWVGLWCYADWSTLMWAAAALVAIMVATIIFEVLPSSRQLAVGGPERTATSFGAMARSFAQCAVPLALLYVLNDPTFQKKLDYAPLQPWYDALNTGDSIVDRLGARSRGYYEGLMNIDSANAQLWETLMRERLAYDYQGAEPVRPVNDFRFRELLPNVHLEAYNTDFQTNRWGMRDRDYEQAKHPGTLRIALLGSSHTMGWGVPQDEVFASIVEQRLNVQPPAGAEYVHFEILNFAVPGLSPLGEISLLQKQIAAFSPDIVLLVTHTVDYKWVSRDLHRSLRSRIPIPSDVLRRALKEARITARTHEVLAADRLKPHEPALLYWCYERIVEESRHLGALPVAIFLPLPDQLPKKLSSAVQQTTLIRQSGLILIDFTRLYDNEHPADLMRPEIWRHSTAQAHALIADALYQRLMTDPDIDLGNRARRVSVAAATPSAITQP